MSDFHDMRRDGSLSVTVDITDPKEVEIVKEVLLMWATNKMIELEIFFKVHIHVMVKFSLLDRT